MRSVPPIVNEDELIDRREVVLAQRRKSDRQAPAFRVIAMSDNFAFYAYGSETSEVHRQLDSLSDGDQRSQKEHSSKRDIVADARECAVGALQLDGRMAAGSLGASALHQRPLRLVPMAIDEGDGGCCSIHDFFSPKRVSWGAHSR
jgi:hypothetical protein